MLVYANDHQFIGRLQTVNMDTPKLAAVVDRLNEYGQIYSNIRSDHTKEQLLRSAPESVLDAFSIVTKNVLIGNISLTKSETDHLRPYKDTMKKLGFDKCSYKMKRRLLAEGDMFSSLSHIMAKLASETVEN